MAERILKKFAKFTFIKLKSTIALLEPPFPVIENILILSHRLHIIDKQSKDGGLRQFRFMPSSTKGTNKSGCYNSIRDINKSIIGQCRLTMSAFD